MGEQGKRGPYRRVRWTAAIRRSFFDALAETCNVKEAAERAGVPQSAVYHQRRTKAGFAGEWHEALDAGYEALETRLVGLAAARMEPGGGGMEAFDTDLALILLSRHRRAMQGKPVNGKRPSRPVPAEDARAILIARLDAYEKKLGLPPLDEANDAGAERAG